ncbi:two pore domain potassium channel family protein [Candidatus Poribacteria bacterium]|jgi:hypothetical protein|nr:two pore domain potassium channel family protein [Candidatus Poribacteria bacterium]MBT5536986.1 two pore domain potassium channel family protein [Candidatus Poribacteria bacterium]MBT5713047.1 two pore domain potassium channel family protein [Candidatus Poribacteria bacterium]MBT7100773.1 two pore domain potassium channel family protein [Candidatus Poribacteria bacterium]MBT7804864.1 two pore domain potassium channel family protein [Candidatus Poribacteria bacterium]
MLRNPIVRIVVFWSVFTFVMGWAGFLAETRMALPLDSSWVGDDRVRAGATYFDGERARDGTVPRRVIIEKEERFTEERITRLRTAGVGSVRVISDRVFSDVLDAMWWSVVTATGVGYGDKKPETGRGRLLAGAHMIVSLACMMLIVANLSAARVVKQLRLDAAGHATPEHPD